VIHCEIGFIVGTIKISQDKDYTKILMWIGKQVVLSLIEKEIANHTYPMD